MLTAIRSAKILVVAIGALAVLAALPAAAWASTRVYFGLGAGWWDPFWPYPYAYYPYRYYPYYYPYRFYPYGSYAWYPPPYYYYDPPAVVVEQPSVYVQREPATLEAGYWYYCPSQSSPGYYPTVPTCRDPWVQVAPRP